AMARRALAFAVEDPFASRGVAGDDAGAATAAAPTCRGRRAAEIRDDRPGLRLGKAARGHRRPGNAGTDDRDDFGVGSRALELSARQRDARHHVARRPVAAGATGLVQARAVLDVRLGIAVLLGRHNNGPEEEKREDLRHSWRIGEVANW